MPAVFRSSIYDRSSAFAGLLLSALLAAGCAESARTLPPEEAARQFPFLVDGKTSREDVLFELGLPTGQYQGEGIFTYRRGDQDLVVAFDCRNVLKRHNLVQVK